MAVSSARQAASGRVTVVVVTHNGRADVGPCLESLIASGIESGQILIVDNASTDGTRELVRRRFPDIRLLDARENHGYGGAANLAARASTGEYIALVNQDVVFRAGWIEHLVRALDADQGAALATPKILLLGDPARVNACGNTPHYTGITTCRGYGQPAEAFDRPEDVPAVSGAAFLIRRGSFERLNRFDPLFFMYLEDTDLSLRAGLAGLRCLFVPEAVVLHDFEPTFSGAKIFWLERNRTMMLVKLYRWRTLLLLMPALLLTDLLVLAYSVSRGPSHLGAKVRAYAWVARRWPSVMRNRRDAQRLRDASDHEILRRLGVRLDVVEIDGRMSRTAAAAANRFYAWWYRLVLRVVTW